jgi:hypothetical protein
VEPQELTNQEKQRHHTQHGRKINVHSKINIPLNMKDYLFYLSKKGAVASHCGHVRCSVIFARTDQINKNVEKMLKDFEVANANPSTASRLLNQIDDHVYGPKAISNSIAKAQKTWLSDRGMHQHKSCVSSGFVRLLDCFPGYLLCILAL